eukprot:3071821-Pleurochrysis_carterae.AAC.1
MEVVVQQQHPLNVDEIGSGSLALASVHFSRVSLSVSIYENYYKIADSRPTSQESTGTNNSQGRDTAKVQRHVYALHIDIINAWRLLRVVEDDYHLS